MADSNFFIQDGNNTLSDNASQQTNLTRGNTTVNNKYINYVINCSNDSCEKIAKLERKIKLKIRENRELQKKVIALNYPLDLHSLNNSNICCDESFNELR